MKLPFVCKPHFYKHSTFKINGLFLYIREELLLEKGKAKNCILKRVLFSSVFPWLKKNILWTPLELKPYFQKGEKDTVSGMKMLVRGMDSRLGIADSV